MTIDTYVTDYAGDWIAALPKASVESVTDILNDKQTMSFSVPQTSPGALAIGGWETEIQVREVIPDLDVNEVVFQGPVVSEEGDKNNATFQCEGVLSHLGTRIIDRASLLCTSMEQRAIGYELVQYAQNEADQAHRDLAIGAAPFSGNTHIRSRNYLREEHGNILDLLQEFPKLDDGFDFDVEIQPDGARWWTPYYPKKGITHDGFRLEYVNGKGNVTNFRYRRDWKKLLTHIYVTGGTNGDVKFEQNYEDAAASAFYGVRQDVISEGSQMDVAWLLDRGKKEVKDRKVPILVPELTVPRNPIDYKRLIFTGDYVPVKVKHGRVNLVVPQRVVQKTWNIKPNTVSFTIAELA